MARPWAVAMMLVAIAILFGTLSRTWAGDELVHLGPAGVETCIATPQLAGSPGPVECKPEAHATLPGDVVALQWMAMIGGFLSAVLCAYGALQLTRERRPPLSLSLFGFGVTAVVMAVFEIRVLTRFSSLSLGLGFIAAIGGVVAAAVLLFLLSPRD